MGTQPNKTVELISVVDGGGGSVCEACGAPRVTASFCRGCAFQLVSDAAASSSLEIMAPPEEEDETPGRTVPRNYAHYEVCLSEAGTPWELGRGSMGITYKATDTHLGRPVALKVINTRRFAKASARIRLMREARAAAQLRHSNIASIFHLGLDDDHCFYAMEYIDGETLEEQIRRTGPMMPAEALRITEQLALALQEAHRQNFIHRDIKPSNVMLTRSSHALRAEPVAKLIDFGLVKAVSVHEDGDEPVIAIYFAGTPTYASPEQLELGLIGVTSDIYSLGMCLRYMLAGSLADQTPASRVGVTKPWRRAPVNSEGNLKAPVPVIALIRAMTANNPERRIQNSTELLTEIRRCQQRITPRRPLGGLRQYQWAVFLTVLMVGLACFVALGTRRPAGFSAGDLSEKNTRLKKARLFYLEGEEALGMNTEADSKKAVELFSMAVACDPEHADAYAALGNAYYQRVARFNAPKDQLEKALVSVQHAIAIDPNSAQAFTVLGTIRSWQGQHWDALGHIYRALEIDQTNPRAMRNFAFLWCTVGQPQLALPWAKAATEKGPTNLHSWVALADATTDLCDDAQAEAGLKKCLEINPVFVDARCSLMHLYLLRGEFDRAEEEYKVIVSIHEPEMILPLTLKAQADLFSGNYAAAERLYLRLLEKDRQGAVDYFSGISYLSALGYLRRRAGDDAQGQIFLEEAVSMHATGAEGPQHVYDLAAVRAIQGRHDDAFALLEQAIGAGWLDHRAMRLDPRFESIRDTSRFRTMADELAKRVARLRVEAERLCERPLSIADYPVHPPPN